MTAALLPFGNLIRDEERIRFVSENQVHRRRVYTPDVTLNAFLTQVVDPGGSCQTAVNSVHAQNAAAKNSATTSLNTSSYARARARLSTEAIKRMAKSIGEDVRQDCEVSWRWKDRSVCILDGSTVTMADTSENAALFPKRKNQKEYNGFPLSRVMLASSLETGTVIDFCMAPFKGKGTGELPLGKKLLAGIDQENVLLADAMFVSYSFMSQCLKRNIDFLVPKKSNRKYRVLHEEIISPGDKLIVIKKPRRPHTGWVDEEEYDQHPETMRLRETKITIERNGFRTVHFTVLSTFLDHEGYSMQDLTELFLSRWNIELDLRIIKRELGMKSLSCKSPAMIEKEIWVHLLAFNLIRRLICFVAKKAGFHPRGLSFKNSLDYYMKTFATRELKLLVKLPEQLLNAISSFRVRKQPDRFEPRARKSNYAHNEFPALTMTRNQWKLLQLMPHLEDLEFSSALLEGIERLKATIPTINGRPKY